MPIKRPFAWLLVAGMACSLTGLAFTWMPEGTRDAEPAPDTSAPAGDSTPASNAPLTLVTEGSPLETASPAPSPEPATPTPAEEVAIAQATAAPTTALAPSDTAVQGLPANIHRSTELPAQAPKARALFDLMNAARSQEGLEPLEWDASLEEVAYARARNLVEHGYFDHYAPDGESAFSELSARGIRYRLAGENLARNNYIETKTVGAAFDGLMNSPGHRANILETRFTLGAVAAVQDGRMWIYVTVFMD